jgi:hypothetical protein
MLQSLFPASRLLLKTSTRSSHGEGRCIIPGPAEDDRITASSDEAKEAGIYGWEEMAANKKGVGVDTVMVYY